MKVTNLLIYSPVQNSYKSFNLFPSPAIFFFYSAFVSMHYFEAKNTAETGQKCICVYIHPASNSSRSEESRFGPAGEMT